MKARWMLQRLRTMSAGEALSRARRRVMLESWRRRRDWPTPPFAVAPGASRYVLPAPDGLPGGNEVGREAGSQLAGRIVLLCQTFSTRHTDWLLDPQSGVVTPPDFGPLLDYRDPALAGNVRNVWEFNRHQHLVTVASAFALTGEEQYAAHVREQLEAWVLQDPFPRGVNWNSPLELGLRLISWVWIARLLAGSGEWDTLFGERGKLWTPIYRHQWMIARLQSVGSSANNHLIGEMAGLFVAASEWPFFAESAAWARHSYRVLSSEAERQYYPSGLNREQAYGYQLFATELLLLAGIEGDRFGRPFGDGYLERLERAVAAAAALAGPGRLLPAYGDGDDGIAVGLPGSSAVLERMRAVVAAWLRPGDEGPPASDGARLGAALVLAGVPARRRSAGRGSPQPGRALDFSDAGLYRLSSAEDDLDVACLADAGELGYLSIAAHGHADALSFTLVAGDEALLVDPGTYTYHFDDAARAYFRGTSAHNTVTVDGVDQSQSSGPFLWTRKAHVTVGRWEPNDSGAVLTATHDGYLRLPDPVEHERTLRLDGRRLTIDDMLTGRAEHTVEWRLHVAPHCEVQVRGTTCEIVGRGHRLSIALDDALEWELLTADSRGGWYSCCFNRCEPTTTLVGTARLVLPLRLHHVLTVSE